MLNLELRDYQVELLDRLRRSIVQHQKTILCANTGAGKCLAIDTPVMLYSGRIVRADEVRDGDLLMGPDSKPRKVLGTCRGTDKMFRVTPAKGDPYVTNSVHVLTLKMNASRNGRSKGEIVDIDIPSYFAETESFRHCAKGFRVPVSFPDREQPSIDPYLVGVWLGDGSRDSMEITLSWEDRSSILPSIDRVAIQHGVSTKEYGKEKGKCSRYGITSERGKENPVLSQFRKWGLMPAKFIPDDIKLGSRETRMDVLAGIIDTDGHLSRGGYDLVFKDKELANDVVFVARSLGLAAYAKQCTKGIKETGFTGQYHRISISGDCSLIPCRVDRKKAPARLINKDALNYGIKVSEIGVGEYAGFEIDGDGRFLLGDFTVTHNTRMAKYILGRAAERNPSGRYGFFVHRRGLVDNASYSFSEEPSLPHGILMSGRECSGGLPIQVGSIDSLLAWYVKDGKWQYDFTFDVLIYDEAHAHLAKLVKVANAQDEKRKQLRKKPCVYIGLSATPSCDGINFFNDIVLGPSAQWLQEQGFAAKFSYYGGKEGKLGLLVKKGGEFTKDSVAKAMEGLAGDLVRDWKKYSGGAPTVGFFPRLSHAEEARRILCDNGIRAEYVDGTTPDEERRAIFGRLNRLEIDYICNVGVIERGTDIGVGCVQLCTAVGSKERYLQMVGRGSRVNATAPDCVVIDHGGNVARHGFWEDDRTWTLDQSEAKLTDGERPTIRCPNCGRVYRGGKCSACAYEPKQTERAAQGLQFDGGELKPITKRDKKPTKMTSEEIMKSALYAAGRSGKTCAQAIFIAKGIAKKKGVTDFKIPKFVEHHGQRTALPSYTSFDRTRKVADVFDWTT